MALCDFLALTNHFSVLPSPSRGRGSGVAGVNLREPLTAVPCSADLSKLVSCFDSFACKLKSMPRSSLNVGNGIELIHSALACSKMRAKTTVNQVTGVVYSCELSGVRRRPKNTESRRTFNKNSCDLLTAITHTEILVAYF